MKKFSLFILFFLLAGISSEEKTKPEIEILITSSNDIYEQGVYGIRSILERDVKISYLDLIQNEDQDLSAYFKKLESSGIKAVITIGKLATKAAQEHLKNTPIIFSFVNSPKSLNLKQENICGISMDVPISEYFQTLRELSTDSTDVVAYYSSPENEFYAGEGDYTDMKFNLFYNKKKLPPGSQVVKDLEEYKGKIDAFYMLNDPLFTRKEFDELSNYCKSKKIVLMTDFPSLVNFGASFSISPDYNKMGIQAAYLTERILSGKSSCKKEKLLQPDFFSFYMNQEYIESSGFRVPKVLSERARMTKLIDAAVSKMNDKKYKSAKIILELILKNDPGNKNAQHLLQIALENVSGELIKNLLQNANQSIQNRNYNQALVSIRKILAINPNHILGKIKLEETVMAFSMQQYQNGLEKDRQYKPYEAIRLFQASLKTLPTNNRASQEIIRIRSSLTPKNPDHLKKGIQSYNSRDYNESIRILEETLLVDPTNKEAIEYLRLSVKKRDAIKILKKKLGS